MKSIPTYLVAAVILLLFPGDVIAGHRIQDEAERGADKAALERTRAAPRDAKGTVTYEVRETRDGVSEVVLRVRIRSLHGAEGRQYRLWLEDEFDNLLVPMKDFQTDARGNAEFTASRRLADVSDYTRVIVSEKKMTAPRKKRRGVPVLVGEISLLED